MLSRERGDEALVEIVHFTSVIHGHGGKRDSRRPGTEMHMMDSSPIPWPVLLLVPAVDEFMEDHYGMKKRIMAPRIATKARNNRWALPVLWLWLSMRQRYQSSIFPQGYAEYIISTPVKDYAVFWTTSSSIFTGCNHEARKSVGRSSAISPACISGVSERWLYFHSSSFRYKPAFSFQMP